jgi:hypothetical protein
MQLACPHCNRSLEFSDDPPIYCGYCGKPLQRSQPQSTAEYIAEAATLPPSAPALSANQEVPKEIGGYRLLRPIGTGGMGTVYEAEDKTSGRHVALKLLSQRFTGSDRAVERFRQEGRLASMLSHPHCVFVFAADEEAGQPYIVMELMTGTTLQDLVRERGPLPLEEAVGKILDVIEGLREAHRLGLIHRDIKPSNCFVEPNGRVKVGDFGLAKALAGSGNLTITGSFMGTPLYASPEQVRGDKVDHQTDVYSVAATLYFLLTGRAPFETGDSAATLARIVSDPAPPMRSLRPELSFALDQVILRGLERDRKRRWRDLEAFQSALQPFVPDQLTPVGLGKRLAAFYLDQFFIGLAVGLCFAVILLTILALRRWSGNSEPVFERNPEESQNLNVPVPIVVLAAFAYFGIAEGLFGCTLAKRMLRLRVVSGNGVDPPGLAKGLLRSAVFTLLFEAGSLVGSFVPANQFGKISVGGGVAIGVVGGGLKLLVLTSMRRRNGFRGLHEFASGTRVVQLPRPSKPGRMARPRTNQEVSRPAGLPATIGNYQIDGLLSRNGESTVYTGKDQTLGRSVWIWSRPISGTPLNSSRQVVDRTTRLRWLGSGQMAESRWDAFLAPPAGCSLFAAIGNDGSIPWSETRTILDEVATELRQADSDGSLPESLGLGHVWLQPNGPTVLLDMPVSGPSESRNENSERRSLSMLRDLTVYASGGSLGNETAPDQLSRPLPLHATALLRRLQRGSAGFTSLQDFSSELKRVTKLPPAISRFARARGAIVTGLFACILVGDTEGGSLLIHSLAQLLRVEPAALQPFSSMYGLVLLDMFVYAGLSVVWLYLTNWTLACWSMRAVLAGPTGEPASRRQRVSRVLLFWSVPFGLTALAWWAVQYQQFLSSQFIEVAWGVAMSLTAAAYFILSLWSPEQSVHDRLLDTYLVPK